MDAVEFLKEYKRLCKCYNNNCLKCPLFETGNCQIVEGKADLKLIVSITEKWSEENPIKTRLKDFLYKYPNAPKYADGFPKVCPVLLGYVRECKKIECDHKQCWNEPVE